MLDSTTEGFVHNAACVNTSRKASHKRTWLLDLLPVHVPPKYNAAKC